MLVTFTYSPTHICIYMLVSAALTWIIYALWCLCSSSILLSWYNPSTIFQVSDFSLQRQPLQQRGPDLLLSSHLHLLFLEENKAFPGKEYNTFSVSSSRRTLPRDASRRYPNQMPETLQSVTLDVDPPQNFFPSLNRLAIMMEGLCCPGRLPGVSQGKLVQGDDPD